MSAWVFVVLISSAAGAIESEAFDHSTAEACQMRRELVLAILMDAPQVSALYVGECKEIRMLRKT